MQTDGGNQSPLTLSQHVDEWSGGRCHCVTRLLFRSKNRGKECDPVNLYFLNIHGPGAFHRDFRVSNLHLFDQQPC